jgi:hypothetical protein
MTNDERHQILCILAYRYGEIYKANNFHTDNVRNWQKAEEALRIDQDINGEDFLLCMLQKENEENT